MPALSSIVFQDDEVSAFAGILEITATQWLIALGIALVVFVVVRGVIAVALKRLKKFAEKTDTDLDDLITELLEKTKSLFVLIVAVWAGSLALTLPDGLDAGLQKVLVVALLFQGALWAGGVVNYLLARYTKRQIEADPGIATALGAVGFMARFGVWAAFVILALDNLGFDVTAVLAGMSIGGIAIALALQSVLGDLFSSLSIVFDKPFVIGDYISVDEFRGTVEHVGLKTTRIRSLTGEQLVFSNSDLLNSRISNFKHRTERRISFTVGVTYDTPPDKLEAIPGMITEIVEGHDNTRMDRSHFLNFGPSSLDIETIYYMEVVDFTIYADTRQKINLELYRRFQEEGIEFAFPTQTVHVQTSGGT